MPSLNLAVSPATDGTYSIRCEPANGHADFAFNLSDPRVIHDPYSVYRQLRAANPIFRSPDLFGGAWLFFDYEDIAALFHDTDHLSNAKARAIVDDLPQPQQCEFEKLIQLHSRWMVFFDPPRHTRLRRLMARGFGASTRARLLNTIREHVNSLISSFRARRQIDVVTDYAARVPLATIASILGLSGPDLGLFSRWTGDLAEYMGLEKPDGDRMKKAQQSLTEFEAHFNHVIAERRRHPMPDDLLSLLIAAEEQGDVLSPEELFAQCAFLGFTGNETTKNLIGNAIYRLLLDDSQRSLLLEDPRLIGQAIEELLRFDSPVQFVGRVVKQPLRYKSARLEPGQYVIFMIGAANRDPMRFRNPDTFDIRREGIRHLSFGEGAHACLGQGLARMEAETAVVSFLEAFSGSVADPTQHVEWQKNPGLRGLKHLPVLLCPGKSMEEWRQLDRAHRHA